MRNVNQLRGEFSKIATLKNQLPPTSDRVLLGIGDDAAIVHSPQERLLLCSDAMVEGVHFDLSFIEPEELGHKVLASCLSDIAAMNGTPLYALISLAVPKSIGDAFLKQMYGGLGSLAKQFKVDIVGGDLTSSKAGLFIDVSLVGSSAHPITRSGAQVGDVIAVTGTPGASGAALKLLQTGQKRNQLPSRLINAHLKPFPRFDAVKELNKTSRSCTSLIDVSDGLSSELHHLAECSGVGFELELKKLPLNPDVLKFYSAEEAISFALSGGEDYELLGTFDLSVAPLPPLFTEIGQVTEVSSGVNCIDRNGSRKPLVATGFNHFESLIRNK